MAAIVDMQFATDQQRWHAIERRDPAADGAFLYAVRTTGIYCRPSCRSRQPNRSNVTFYTTCRGAERAGFRACKRCKPSGERAMMSETIARACRYIDMTDRPPSLAQVANVVGLSPAYFHRCFKSIVGVTPKEYAAARRVERLRHELAGDTTATTAIYESGFRSSSRLYEQVGRTLGMAPLAYKRGGKGMRIRYAIVTCELGWVLVAATDRGICTVELGDHRQPLLDRLLARFAEAEVAEADEVVNGWVAQIVQAIRAPSLSRDLPLDVQGTAFQRRVWRALQSIPPGSTTTYGELARAIGNPAAARAVARACATNPAAVVIPCHRVIGSSGNLTGYRWGIERKRKLLEQESLSVRRQKNR